MENTSFLSPGVYGDESEQRPSNTLRHNVLKNSKHQERSFYSSICDGQHHPLGKTKDHLDNKLLGMPMRDYLGQVSLTGKITLKLGVLERELSISIRCPLPPDCGHTVTSHSKF